MGLSRLKILLIGEFSGVHWTLAEGLRELGHKVTVASLGNPPRNFPRDIDLNQDYTQRAKTFKQKLFNAKQIFTKMSGFDVVQWINPLVLGSTLIEEQKLYAKLKRANGSFFLGSFGADAVFLEHCIQGKPSYSIYSEFIGKKLPADIFPYESCWQLPNYVDWNIRMANEATGIIAALPEYYEAYSQSQWAGKTHFVPLPINTETLPARFARQANTPLKIGMVEQPGRDAVKGWSQMMRLLGALKERMGQNLEVDIAQPMPYVQYLEWLRSQDVLFDQALSHGPGIAALVAMSMGIPSFSGGEEYYYGMLNEPKIRPILNYRPGEEVGLLAEIEALCEMDVYERISAEGKALVQHHHTALNVAKQYESIYLKAVRH
jgi:hypothetical protein